MTCKEFRNLIGDHHAGELVVDVEQKFETHRTTCPECGFYLESYTHTVKVTRLLPKCGPLPPGLEAKLRAVIEDHFKTAKAE